MITPALDNKPDNTPSSDKKLHRFTTSLEKATSTAWGISVNSITNMESKLITQTKLNGVFDITFSSYIGMYMKCDCKHIMVRKVVNFVKAIKEKGSV